MTDTNQSGGMNGRQFLEECTVEYKSYGHTFCGGNGSGGVVDGTQRLNDINAELLGALLLVAESGAFSCSNDDHWQVVNDAIDKAKV
jgi:hypothetical protein